MNFTEQSLQALVSARLTGELTHNSRSINEQAIRELIAHNPYWSLSSMTVSAQDFNYDEARARLVVSFGLTIAEFESSEISTIRPERTAERLYSGILAMREVAKRGGKILLVTGHPGSLLEMYGRIGAQLVALGGVLVEIDGRMNGSDRHFLDQIHGVITLTDEGSLVHTHKGEGLVNVIDATKPDIIMADHGFASVAIDTGIPTVAIYDTDDPAIPLAATIKDTVIAVPMNDNQTNIVTANAVDAFIGYQDAS